MQTRKAVIKKLCPKSTGRPLQKVKHIRTQTIFNLFSHGKEEVAGFPCLLIGINATVCTDLRGQPITPSKKRKMKQGETSGGDGKERVSISGTVPHD